MRKEDLAQDLSISGLRYARILTENITAEEAETLKQKYSYVHIYSYKPASLAEFDIRTQKTSLIDLTQGEDKIFAGFQSSARQRVRKSEQIPGLEIKILDKNFSGSYGFYKRAKQLDDAPPDIKREFEECVFFNAYLSGRMIVTMSFYDNGEIVRSKHIASLRKIVNSEKQQTISNASRRLIWEACKWGGANGRKFLDLGGINFDDLAKAGVRAFKESFGGKVADVYIYKYETAAFSKLKKLLNFFGRNIN